MSRMRRPSVGFCCTQVHDSCPIALVEPSSERRLIRSMAVSLLELKSIRQAEVSLPWLSVNAPKVCVAAARHPESSSRTALGTVAPTELDPEEAALEPPAPAMQASTITR